MESLHHFLKDELSEGIDRGEKTTERLLLSVKTIDKLLIFNLNLPDCVHLEFERFVCHDWVIAEHVLKVFQGRRLGLESVSEHGLAKLLLVLSLQVNDLIFDILRHLIRHLLDGLTDFNAILHDSWRS